MRKLFLSIIAVVCCFTANAVGTQPSTGNGSQANPYQIETLDNLLWFANHVNSENASACAILTADITMNEGVLDSYGRLNSDNTFTAWTRIGGHGVDYSGEFNGNGHTISGLYFNDTSKNNVGLFGKANNGAYIHDLGIRDSYFYGKDHVGGICGDFANGRIEDCWNASFVEAYDYDADGISGSCWKYASIANCYNIGTVSTYEPKGGTQDPRFGGICGSVYSTTTATYTIDNCYTLSNFECDKIYGLLVEGCPESKVHDSYVKKAAAFIGGEVCYRLNHGVTDGSQKWYQTLGIDQSPVLNNSHGIVFYGYEGNVLKYSNSQLTIPTAHHEICAAACNAVGYSQDCWEDNNSGRIYTEAACLHELNAAAVVSYIPSAADPTYLINQGDVTGWTQEVNQRYDGVNFGYAAVKVFEDYDGTNDNYGPDEWVSFKVAEANAQNARLKWSWTRDGAKEQRGRYGRCTIIYKVNDGAETEITLPSTPFEVSPDVYALNLGNLSKDDVVEFHIRDYYTTISAPCEVTWAVTLEYITGHDVQHVDAMAATCTEKGNYENWYCKKCDKHFADAECTTVMTDWEISALGHTTEYRAQKAATCTEDGYTMNHWHCTVCGRNYADQACTNLITEDVVLPKIGHENKEHQARVEATCLTDGNIEYWYCPDCNTHFTDEACTTPTTEITIAALGHDFTHTPYTTSTCTSEGVVEHWHCGRCGHDFDTGDEMASEDHVISGSLTIPCKESDVILVGMDEGKIYDDCHTFTPPTEGEGETLIATVTFDGDAVKMKVKNGEETAYSLNGNKPLETFFAHTFTLTANQDPDHIENYYSTFYTSECAYKLPASVEAYIGTVGKYGGANVLNLTQTDTIHAGEAVILRAQPANTADRQTGITLMPSCNRRAASEDNKLTGTDVAVDALGPDDYALTLGQKGVGFYNWSGRPLGAHKAYLRWSGSKLTSSGSFGFVFDDGTVTGIGSQEIPFVPDATGTYDLSGIPVDDSYDGIVIKDGKKYISNGPM